MPGAATSILEYIIPVQEIGKDTPDHTQACQLPESADILVWTTGT